MHGPPQMPYVAPPNTAPPLRRRGVILSIFLFLGILGNVVAIPACLYTAKTMKKAITGIDPDADAVARSAAKLMVVVACLAIARLVSLVGIWGWKRWGIYGYLGCSVLSSIMSFRAGTTPAAILYDVLTTALVTTMLLAKRHQFD
jgi:hypothetical protein